jgi:hypothetical protein
MQVKHNLRAELAIIASRASDLEKAFLALPDTEAAMDEALQAMSTEEKKQSASYVRMLSQKCFSIRNECQWIAVRLEGGI